MLISKVPTPALTAYDGTDQDENDPHFCYLLDGSKMSDSVRKKAMTKKGSIAIGEPLLDDWSKCPHVDLVVVGSVAVTSSGRRLGKGWIRYVFRFSWIVRIFLSSNFDHLSPNFSKNFIARKIGGTWLSVPFL